MQHRVGTLFQIPRTTSPSEIFETLCSGNGFRLERIVSTGQVTPQGDWYDQKQDEWVAVLIGRATLLFESAAENLELKPGDYVFIPARCRHRVEWTDPETPTVWLALHFDSTSATSS